MYTAATQSRPDQCPAVTNVAEHEGSWAERLPPQGVDEYLLLASKQFVKTRNSIFTVVYNAPSELKSTDTVQIANATIAGGCDFNRRESDDTLCVLSTLASHTPAYHRR
jgi:hypothetical protein